LYGFNPPIHEALGYGKGLHDALAEIHKRAINGDLASIAEAENLVTRHLHTPYAYPELRATLHRAAVVAVQRYLREHDADHGQTGTDQGSRRLATRQRPSPVAGLERAVRPVRPGRTLPGRADGGEA